MKVKDFLRVYEDGYLLVETYDEETHEYVTLFDDEKDEEECCDAWDMDFINRNVISITAWETNDGYIKFCVYI